MILHGDSFELLKTLHENSIDSMVTDPPAGINFMGKSWDKYGSLDNFQDAMKNIFDECFRVMKPGSHGLVWAIPRTSHHTAMALERCGFEIRDVVTHLFGTGFPKSHDVSKAIDKMKGAERAREKCGKLGSKTSFADDKWTQENAGQRIVDTPITDVAKQWNGWGTALKPASEHWILIRKPLEKGLTVADNVLKYRTGAINIDESRIESDDQDDLSKNWTEIKGRWPANVTLDEQAAEMLDVQSGLNASRFFYVAKASKSERNAGLDGMPEKENLNQNFHPTVKSLSLMEYLIKLITPSKGTVLDPFMGSGSTGCAAIKLGFQFIGIERESEYVEIATKRIEYCEA